MRDAPIALALLVASATFLAGSALAEPETPPRFVVFEIFTRPG